MGVLDDFLQPFDYSTAETASKHQKADGGPEKRSIFDYFNDMSYDKKLLAFEDKIVGGKFPDVSPYMAAKNFGNFVDSILFANEMNRLPHIPAEAQYLFYTYGLPKRKRFAKWYKDQELNKESIEAIAKWYSYSTTEAEQFLDVLSAEEINIIKQKVNNEHYESTKVKRTSRRRT